MEPKVRFKKDDGADYGSWKIKELSQTCECLDNKRKPIPKRDREDGPYPYYGSTNIQGYVSNYIFDEPLVLLSEDAGPFMDFQNKSLTQWAEGKYWVNNHAHVLRPFENRKFIFYVLEHKDIREYINNPNRPKLNQEDMMKIELCIPCIEEQQKIADFLSNVDSIIEENQAELRNLETQKKEAMKKIFSQEVRFKKDDGTKYSEWVEKKLGDICEVTMGQSPKGSTYSDKPSNYILVQGNADLKNRSVSPRIWTTQKTKMAKAGDLIMSVRAPAGIIGKTNHDVVLGRGVASIKGDEFIYQILLKYEFEGYWKKFAVGSTFESISSKNIKEATIFIPSETEEQQKIADFLSAFDTAIDLTRQEIEKWKETKKGIMQNLFV